MDLMDLNPIAQMNCYPIDHEELISDVEQLVQLRDGLLGENTELRQKLALLTTVLNKVSTSLAETRQSVVSISDELHQLKVRHKVLTDNNKQSEKTNTELNTKNSELQKSIK